MDEHDLVVPDFEIFSRCIDYLPVGLLTVAIANGLPKASTLAQRHWPVRLWVGSRDEGGCSRLCHVDTVMTNATACCNQSNGLPVALRDNSLGGSFPCKFLCTFRASDTCKGQVDKLGIIQRRTYSNASNVINVFRLLTH